MTCTNVCISMMNCNLYGHEYFGQVHYNEKNTNIIILILNFKMLSLSVSE